MKVERLQTAMLEFGFGKILQIGENYHKIVFSNAF